MSTPCTKCGKDATCLSDDRETRFVPVYQGQVLCPACYPRERWWHLSERDLCGLAFLVIACVILAGVMALGRLIDDGVETLIWGHPIAESYEDEIDRDPLDR